jgi:hypothetical protein
LTPPQFLLDRLLLQVQFAEGEGRVPDEQIEQLMLATRWFLNVLQRYTSLRRPTFKMMTSRRFDSTL